MTKQSLLITGSSGYLGQDFLSDKRIKKFKVITLDKDQAKQPNINKNSTNTPKSPDKRDNKL